MNENVDETNTPELRIKKLELELKKLRQELQILRERINDLGKHHDKFGPVKMKGEPFSLF